MSLLSPNTVAFLSDPTVGDVYFGLCFKLQCALARSPPAFPQQSRFFCTCSGHVCAALSEAESCTAVWGKARGESVVPSHRMARQSQGVSCLSMFAPRLGGCVREKMGQMVSRRVHLCYRFRGRDAGLVVRARPNQGEVAPTALSSISRGGKLPYPATSRPVDFQYPLTIGALQTVIGVIRNPRYVDL
jgi:hypothetical protein